jgi:DNA-binding transcriptional LysR family regulator
MDWNDLNLVLAICRTGTLSGAAKALGVNHSTVFRRVNAIERQLGVRLFDRQPDGYAMTEAGEAMQRTAEAIDERVHDLHRELLGRDLRLQGPLRITAPEGIAVRILTPLLSEFCAEHPRIRLSLITTSDALQLSRREADVALRVTRKPPEQLIGRRICRFRFALYAARSYLKTHSETELEDHRWILTEESFEQLPAALWKKKHRSTAQIQFTSNSLMATIAAVRRGLGVAPLPCFVGDDERSLVRLTDPLEELTMDLWVLTHPDLRSTARVSAMTAFLVEAMSRHKAQFEGSQAPGTRAGPQRTRRRRRDAT